MTDIIINLNDKNGIITTKKIKGCLKSIILNFPVSINVSIRSELGYPIFENREIIGQQYIAPRTQSKDEQGHRISFSSEDFLLDEKLIIAYNKNTLTKDQSSLLLRIE